MPTRTTTATRPKSLDEAQGENAESMARSTQIVADSNQGPVNIYLQGHQDGVQEGTEDVVSNVLQGVTIVILIIVIGFVIIGMAK